ncbi:glycosyl transferase [Rhizocola hellebori]|uniref:Glycosyl transferase n=1 Tax=Rhizocola hellebori TaxID=1392758 RepID=A0A8J3QF96_9ACTN|nr:glycosyltransferase [Rhizocola hellebori]GIH09794.1 glycosyl transferase [Rhizocola hellebori]
MKLSVVIPTYNRSDILRLTLESLVHQDLDHDDYEVLVIDDGSSDDTAEVVKEYMDRMNLRYFFQEDEGYRAAGARNVGIANVKADITVFMDSGVLAHSGCLRAHLASHEATDGPAAVIGYVYGYSLNNENAKEVAESTDLSDVDGTIELWRKEGLYGDIREEFFEREGDDCATAPAPWLMYWTFNASIPTEVLRRAGGFDDAFRAWGGEDVDLGYRLHREGARMFLNREAMCLHWPHPRDWDELHGDAVANYQYMARKYDTPITRLLGVVPTINFFVINDVIRGRQLTH